MDTTTLGAAQALAKSIPGTAVSEAAAVLEEAETVAASIPQDYSTLSDDVTDLKSALNGQVPMDFSNIGNQYISGKTIGSAIAFSNSQASVTIKRLVQVEAGKIYTIVIRDSQSPASIASRDGVITDANGIVRQVFSYTNAAGSVNTIKLTAVTDGYVYIGLDKNYVGITVYGGAIDEIKQDIAYSTGERIETAWTKGYIATSGAVGSTVDVSTVTAGADWYCAVLSVNPGEVYTLSISGGGTPRAWCVTDDEYAILANAGAYAALNDDEITIPANGAYLVLNNTVAKQQAPKIVKGGIIETRIDGINQTLATILGGEFVRSRKDDYRWNAESGAITMTDFVSGDTLAMVAPQSCMKVVVYDISGGGYKGWWNESTQALGAENAATEFNVIDFTKLRAKYPDYQFIVKCTGTADATYPASNIDIYYIPFEYKDCSRRNYVQNALNSGDCVCRVINRSTGSTSSDNSWMSTIDFIPDYWARIKVVTSSAVELIAYSSSGVCQGALYTSGITKNYVLNMTEIDFDRIRSIFPTYKFKINLLSTAMDISGLGNVTIDMEKWNTAQHRRDCYYIPTRFTREQFYSRTIEGAAEANVSAQGVCTDGTYIYAAYLKVADVYIMKINQSGELVSENNLGNIGHANQLAYDPNNGVILAACGTGATIQTIDPSTLELGEPLVLTDVLNEMAAKYIGTATLALWNISYYAAKDAWIVGSGTTFVITSADFTKIFKVICMDKGNGDRQMIYPKDDYLLNAFVNGNFAYSATDWSGRTITTFDAQRTNGTGYSEFEGCCELGGAFYTYWNAPSTEIRIAKQEIAGYSIVPVAEVVKQFDFGS